MTTEAPPEPRSTAFSYLMNAVIFRALTLAMTLWAAGDWTWSWAWLNIAVFVVFDALSIFLVDPSLLVERKRRSADQKAWDKPLVGLAVALLPMLILILAGLEHRNGWSRGIPDLAQWVATGLIALGYGFTVWAMRVNSFFSAIVRIQTDRGHKVATGGPYQIVRHPGYVGAILFTIATPIMLDSLWGLIPAVIAAGVYVVRTHMEDVTLQEELPGYREFTQQTRYRLIPGVW